jgi:hypothetical protein
VWIVTILRAKGLTKSISNTSRAFSSMIRSLTIGITVNTMSKVQITKETIYRLN